MMKNYYAYYNPQGPSIHMYVCAASKRVAEEIVESVMKTKGFTIRAITKSTDNETYDLFNDYFQYRQGYADTIKLLHKAEDIHKFKFIHYMTRQEKIDSLLS